MVKTEQSYFVENTPRQSSESYKDYCQRIRSISTVYGCFDAPEFANSVWYATIRKEQMRSWLSMDT